MRDLINSTIETLIELGEEKYVEESRVSHEFKDMLVTALKSLRNNNIANHSKVIAQALFESGMISYDENENFTLNSIEKYIYGGKMTQAVEVFQSLHTDLKSRGFTSPDNTYNSSGDNYYCALEYAIKPTESEVATRALSDKLMGKEPANSRAFATDIYRKIIVIENQSPMYAIILDHSIFTGDPDTMTIVQLKDNYNDDAKLAKFIKHEFVLENCPCESLNSYRTSKRKVIAELDIVKMEVSSVQHPATIESALFSLYSGFDSIVCAYDTPAQSPNKEK